MLVLKRKINESIMIGDDIEITILSYDKDGIRIGIDAPKSKPIFRKELYIAIQEENQQAGKGNKEKMAELQELFKGMGKK